MPSQTESGKAFEYAFAMSLFKKIKDRRHVNLIKDTTFDNTYKCFKMFGVLEQSNYKAAADAAVNQILLLEPCLKHPLVSKASLTISIQEDRQGRKGDVRDIVTVSKKDGWEIGFSAKNMHNAVKHSRLSDKIDFGKQWLGIKCSNTYMSKAKTIFGKLRTIQKKDPAAKWRDLANKESKYYMPILKAFEQEIRRINQSNTGVPRRLVEYLIGMHDFYKIMKYDKYTLIQGYNLHSDLNKNSKNVKAKYKVRQLNFPTEIIQTKIKGSNTLLITFDDGWTLSFRIHNARTKIEPSLKFDITLVGIPNTMYNDRVSW